MIRYRIETNKIENLLKIILKCDIKIMIIFRNERIIKMKIELIGGCTKDELERRIQNARAAQQSLR